MGPSGALPETATRWLGRWWLLALPLTAVAWLLGPLAERGLIGLALVLAAGSVAVHRRGLAGIVAGLLIAANLCLALHLLADDFGYHYVWLYSAPELPAYLKLANLWGGDEGTLLFLAALLAIAATRLPGRPSFARTGALIGAAWFAGGALIWDPFAATPAADLARQQSQGMNAHLLSPWMALHPPLVFGAYVLFLAPVGGALQALVGGAGGWAADAQRWLRNGWLVLSAGLAVGMWWAYEDFTFGQFWHWDPVQTSVFVVWCLASAELHGLPRYRAQGRFARSVPMLAGATATACLISMAITRSAVLASSHRYIGASSQVLMLAGAGLLAGATPAALAFGWRRRRRARPPPAGEPTVLMTIAMLGFVAAAAIAAGCLIQALLGAWLGWPRPASLKPFFETLTRWTRAGELSALRAAFAQWDVDRYAANAWLAPVASLLALACGHYFLPIASRARRWPVTAGVIGLALAVAMWLRPLDHLFTGTGLTSSSTVAIFPSLEVLGVAALFLLLSVLAWSARAARRSATEGRFWRYGLPLALIHGGVMLALLGASAATILDSYAQKMITWPDDFGQPIRLPDGFTVDVHLEDDALAPDGARGGGFRSIAKVSWRLSQDGRLLERQEGHSVYRDDRPPAAGDRGPVRLMCEILDYRYARYASGTTQMIHPFIHRGLLRDVQVWLPAIDYTAGLAAGGASPAAITRQVTMVPVVLKVYPLISLLWVGLALALLGALVRRLVA
jgi:cytochrome c-type biogenesis protein CcmF